MKNPATPAGRHLWTAVLALTVLASVACSGDDPSAANGSHHDHGSSVEVAEGAPVPTIEIDISEDPVEGWNLRVLTTDFEIVPENVSTAHVDGEGHMHLYIDGEKVSRLYGEWHHIGPLAPGEHEVRVELSANDHSAMAVDGDIIDATAVIVAGDMGGHAMGHDGPATRESQRPRPSVTAELVDDPAGGWSLHAVPSNFRLAPENASGDHVDGEGYMYLYINGEEVARIYETWHQMPPLPAGTHDITVIMRTNDHAPLTRGGVVIAAFATLEVSEDEATLPAAGEGDHGGGDHAMASAPNPYDADVANAVQTIVVDVVGGAPVGGVRRVEAELGSVVALMVTSDLAEEVHVHGYDILRGVSEGKPAHFAFTTEIPGVFEVEFEGSGRLLLQLEIS